MAVKTITIKDDFTDAPGGRREAEGPFSGEEFRRTLLEHPMRNSEIERIVVVLDGVEGYATSFLEEAFGGLARILGARACHEKLEFVSHEDPLLAKEIWRYIDEYEA